MQGLRNQTSRIPRGSDTPPGLAAGDPLLRAAPLRAVEFVRWMHGSTSPALLLCDDGQYYVVKSKRGCVHERALANEMLAGLLGVSLGLPLPDPVVVSVPSVLLEDPLHPGAGDRDGADPADVMCFGSAYAGANRGALVVDSLPEKLLRRVANLHAAFLGAFILDTWTDNRGRRKAVFVRAVALDRAPYSVQLIDHDECFSGGQWALKEFRISCLYPSSLVYEEALNVDSFEPFLSRIEGLQAAQLVRFARAIPPGWCGANAREILDLADRLFDRRLRLRQTVLDVLKEKSKLLSWPLGRAGL